MLYIWFGVNTFSWSPAKAPGRKLAVHWTCEMNCRTERSTQYVIWLNRPYVNFGPLPATVRHEVI